VETKSGGSAIGVDGVLRSRGWITTVLLSALPLAAPAWSEPKPFSHKAHLAAGLQCEGCHAAAITSVKSSDNNLPGEKACRDCHESVRIKDPRKTLLKDFNHQLHLKLGNAAPLLAKAIDSGAYLAPPGDIRPRLETKNACMACHRGLEESESPGKEALPQMADCLVCHSKIDAPFSCEKCHEPGAHLKPPDHTSDYIDRHSSGKLTLDKKSCVICHGRRFTCLGCH